MFWGALAAEFDLAYLETAGPGHQLSGYTIVDGILIVINGFEFPVTPTSQSPSLFRVRCSMEYGEHKLDRTSETATLEPGRDFVAAFVQEVMTIAADDPGTGVDRLLAQVSGPFGAIARKVLLKKGEVEALERLAERADLPKAVSGTGKIDDLPKPSK